LLCEDSTRRNTDGSITKTKQTKFIKYLFRIKQMNNLNEMNNEVFTSEELEARFEMEAIVDGGDENTPDGSCTCRVEW